MHTRLINSRFSDHTRPKCLSAADNVRQALQVVNKLPVLNKRVLHYLVDFLRRFAEPVAEEKTKMTASNLATVFAPNLLRAPDNQVTPQSINVDLVLN
jgi:hypothetical protein